MAKNKNTTSKTTRTKQPIVTKIALEYLLRIAIKSRDVNEVERVEFVKFLEELKD